ncbi:MFS transporter [Portibacter lacus]|uniref:MFS transporter n=1 Tax=Portibacter lacus TaxID=1099794 RepID=A0AA37SSK4_9BACT|nr:MFS transporter [Portibacter lacus]GLR18021.1 MFS transporter [Portibacter lacus]
MQNKQPFYNILLLILAGEAVFILPFVLVRIFRPTVLDLFELTNLELGLCFSVYGVVAIIAYFFGGIVADRFSPGKLMGIALILTAAGGLVMATYPQLGTLRMLYGYWGFTTIFLFWAAMIKATRMWGGADRQGKAFGFLDGGRGLVAAGFGSLGLAVLGLFVIGDMEALPMADRKEAFQYLIWTFSGVVALIGLITFFFLKESKESKDIEVKKQKMSLKDFPVLLRMRVVWLLMVIILTGYCGYKITDIFSLYAKDVMLYDEIKAAGIGTMLLYIRPILGIVIGFLADRSASSLWLAIGFGVMTLGALVLASGIIGPSLVLVFGLSIFATSLGVYAIRSLYFAIMEEGNIPLALTGTAVGIASLIGYTPDVFMGPLIGVLLDNNPGELGHQYVFGFMAVMGLIGGITTLYFRKYYTKKV